MFWGSGRSFAFSKVKISFSEWGGSVNCSASWSVNYSVNWGVNYSVNWSVSYSVEFYKGKVSVEKRVFLRRLCFLEIWLIVY